MTQQSLMTLDQIRAALADRNIKVVARQSGVKYHTVLGVANGRNQNPSYETYKALAEYLAK